MSFEIDPGTSDVINYKMSGTFKHVINMANSIIGVSILSMPYCFKEAGLVLGVLLILFSGFITKKTCMFLIRAAIMSRRRSYELLAFQVFGVTGKLLMEMCMILFLIGICISFHVVMGDLAPAIVAKYMVIENSPALRCTLLVGMVLLVILPLCLLRNLDSLASMSACSIGFYVFLNCIIFYMALPNLLDGTWFSKAKLFHFDSAFRVLPIMTLALSCQSNVFEIYDSIPDPDVIKMKNVVSQAVNICCALYIGVGFLGYIAFIDTDVTGNVIMKFPVSKMTDCITIFFVVSLAISFPLMLFPCRTSIHSLCYKRETGENSLSESSKVIKLSDSLNENTQISYDLVGNYMPESRFKGITLSVLLSSLVIGILLPNIEFVLGLLGSTMGVTIAFILPSVFYIKVYTKTSCDRFLAQGFMLLGIFIMVSGTYLHLSGLQNTETTVVTLPPEVKKLEDIAKNIPVNELAKVPEIVAKNEEKAAAADLTGRKEPAIPEPPNSDQEAEEKKPIEPIIEVANDKKSAQESAVVDVPKIVPNADLKIDVEQSKIKEEAKIVKKDVKEEDKLVFETSDVKEEVLHPDAIRKEEKENMEESKGKANIEEKQEEILKQMEHQQNEQKKLIEEQKKILQELKDQKEKIEVVQKEKIAEQNEKVEVIEKEKIAEIVKPELKIKEGIKQKYSANENQSLDLKNQKILPNVDLNLPLVNSRQNLDVVLQNAEVIPQNSANKILQNSVNNIVPQSVEKIPQLPEENLIQPVVKLPKMLVENLPQMPVQNPHEFINNLPQVPVENLINLPVVKMPQKLKMPAIRMDKKQVIDNHSFEALSNVKNGVNNIDNNNNLIQEASQVVNLPLKAEAIKFAQDKPISGQNVKSKPVKQQPHGALNNLINKGAREELNAAVRQVADAKPLVISNKSPKQEINVREEDPSVKHDEERRKRDVSFVEENKVFNEDEARPVQGLESLDVKAVPIQRSDRLSLDADVNLEESNKVFDSESKNVVDALFETRHLLWLKRGRRRKRRNEQFPEYWDEI